MFILLFSYTERMMIITKMFLNTLVVIFWLHHLSSLIYGCRISEFYCDNGECVGLDKFCDGNRDCQDGSDETRFCTRCNRTYYGDRHKTYSLEIATPSPNKLPYVCTLTFLAGYGDLGDIIELSFEQFHIGHYVRATGAGTESSCVGGYMQILERNIEPSSAGHWCGPSPSNSVYYSETNNVTVILTALTVDEDHGIGFTFALKFRYLSKQDAITRYGPTSSQYQRGEWIPMSICDRSFQDCDSQPCKVHSPNYPGLYPRNVRCLYHITQRTIPSRKHAFIILQQRNEDKLSIKDNDASGGGSGGLIAYRREKSLLFGDKCIRDYVQVYDGSDTSAPVLAKFCRSGALAPIVSSGPEMVIELRTTVADILDLHSFELDVEVIFMPENDVGLRMVGHTCTWDLYADERRSGVIHSLRHLAPPNTSCLYNFNGRKHDIVWLYFVKYFIENKGVMDRAAGMHQGSIKGELYDGNPLIGEPGALVKLLATFDDNSKAKLCVHARSFPNFIPLRPCKYPDESYLSSGPELFLRYNFSAHFSLQYLHLEARYEFVDTYQDGEPLLGSAGSISPDSCDREFRSSKSTHGSWTSPKNVFLFGRGGRKSLRCSYKFIGQEPETIRLTFHKIRLGNRKCDTYFDLHSRRYVCQPEADGPFGATTDGHAQEEAEIRISQTLWGRAEMPMACLCRMPDDKPLTIDLMSTVIHVNFSVTGMTSLEDFDSFYFEASYEFVQNVHCNSEHVLDGRGAGGEIAVVVTESDLTSSLTEVKCPWLLPADYDQFVQLRIPGVTPSENCETNNRVIVFAADEMEPIAVVCPSVRSSTAGVDNGAHPMVAGTGTGAQWSGTSASVGEVEVYTRSWNKTLLPGRLQSNTLVVEFHASEPGRFYFKWSRGIKSHMNKLLGRKSRSEECATKCSELDGGCTGGTSVWCEKQAPCTSASNGDGDCTTTAQFPWLYVGIGIGCGILVTVILVASLLHRRRETKAKKGKPVPTDEYSMDGKEIDC